MFDKLRRAWDLRDIDKGVTRHGWRAIYVGDYATAPTWAYTIGFEETLGQPEIVVFDLTPADANPLLWWIFKSLQSGKLRLRDGEAWAPEGEPLGVWRQVHPTQVRTQDSWFAAGLDWRAQKGANGPYRAFQLVIRDGDGKYPWDEGYDERLRAKQPALYRPAVDYGDAPLPSGDREALRVADERGWSIRLVDAPELKWAYTIGLPDLGHPELICIIPSANGAANMLHEAQAHVARGDTVLEDGLRWDGLGFEACWRRVHESHYMALNRFFLSKLHRERRTGRREPVEAYQLFLPDDDGRYPWDAGCKVAASQPQLCLPFDPAQLKRGPLAALMRG